MKQLSHTLLAALLLCSQLITAQSPVHIEVNAGRETGVMKPFWSYFGYDEPNYTYREYGKKLLTELVRLSPVPVIVRTHNLLTSKGGAKDLI